MFASDLATNAMLLGYADMLIADLADEDFTAQPLPATNHPAWILGHLAYVADGVIGLLGGEKLIDPEWGAKFGRDSKISSQRSDYPSREELVRAFRATHARVRELAAKADPERMQRPNPNARLRERFPTIGEMCTFLMTGHLGVHLGQLSAWRRMRGLPPML